MGSTLFVFAYVAFGVAYLVWARAEIKRINDAAKKRHDAVKEFAGALRYSAARTEALSARIKLAKTGGVIIDLVPVASERDKGSEYMQTNAETVRAEDAWYYANLASRQGE
jgi:hypothetical protein